MKNEKLKAIILCTFIVSVFTAISVSAVSAGKKVPQCVNDSQVVKADGYGLRNIKYNTITSAYGSSRDRAEEFLRKMNKDSYIEQRPNEYELVEMYYRRVE